MGRLKEGVKYIYEKVNGITYSREFGSTDREIIGIDRHLEEMLKEVHEEALWRDIRAAAKDNPSLKYTLEKAKMIYELSRKD